MRLSSRDFKSLASTGFATRANIWKLSPLNDLGKPPAEDTPLGNLLAVATVVASIPRELLRRSRRMRSLTSCFFNCPTKAQPGRRS